MRASRLCRNKFEKPRETRTQRIHHLPIDINSLITEIPKAELHLHLEGSISPKTAVELAARHGVALTENEVADRYSTTGFLEFLESFKWVTSFLRTPADCALIANNLAEYLLSQNVVYAEVTLSIGVMLLRKQDPLANFQAIRDAVAKFEHPSPTQRHALRLNWIFDAVRHFGAPAAMEVAKLAAQTPRNSVVAFGIGGDELGLPTRDLIPVYDFARASGLAPLIHAGEVGGPEQIRDAIEYLNVVRVGHGIAAMHDESLMDLLTERRIPLELCPTSNLRTGALARQLHRANDPSLTITDHPLRMLFNRGVPVTLSTDDPTMFETTLLHEYNLAAQAGFTPAEIVRLAQASFEHALLAAAQKQNYISALKNSVAESTPNSSGSLL